MDDLRSECAAVDWPTGFACATAGRRQGECEKCFLGGAPHAREERGVPLDIEQSGDELLAWLETEFGGMLEFVRWFTLLCRGDQERVRSLALALDRPH